MLLTIPIFNKSKRYQRPDVKDNDQINQLVRCYNVSKTSVSFRYQLKRLCDVLSRSVSLTYQLSHRYDVSNWSVLFTYQWEVAKTSQIGLPYWRTRLDVVIMSQHGPGRLNWSLKLVNFFWVLDSTFFGISGDSVSLRYRLVRNYNISKKSVSFTHQLWRLCDVLSWSVLLRYQLVPRPWRLKFVGFLYVPMRRHKDVLNRSVSFTYQLRRLADVLAWSATSWPIWDLNETLLRRRMPGGVFFNGKKICKFETDNKNVNFSTQFY